MTVLMGSLVHAVFYLRMKLHVFHIIEVHRIRPVEHGDWGHTGEFRHGEQLCVLVAQTPFDPVEDVSPGRVAAKRARGARGGGKNRGNETWRPQKTASPNSYIGA